MESEKGCMKCGSQDAATESVAMSGTGLSKIFDIQHNQFIVAYCRSCGYSEFYKRTSSTAGNVIDFFFGG